MQKPARTKLQLRKETVRMLSLGFALAADPDANPVALGTCAASCTASCETA